MTLQRRLLHAMLALLGLAALAGVSTIFMPGSDFVGRVAGTLVIAAFAMGFAIPASRRLDRQETRPAGLFALSAVVVGFALGLLAIWGSLVFPQADEQLAISALVYLPCALVAVICVELARHPASRLAGRVGFVCTTLAFLLWIAAIWGRWDMPGIAVWGRLAGSGAMVGIAAVLLPLGLFGAGRRHWWRWVGVAATAVGVVMGLYGIWSGSTDDPTWLIQPFIVAAALGAANVLLRVPLPGRQRWLVVATTLVLLATAVVASMLNVESRGFQHTSEVSLLQRLLAAGAIVGVCGVLAIGLLAMLGRRALVTSSHQLDAIRGIDLACPRCGVRQHAALGESRCTGCGLIFLLRVAEPRCPQCDHLLFDLRSSVCPECGAACGAECGARVMAPEAGMVGQTSSI